MDGAVVNQFPPGSQDSIAPPGLQVDTGISQFAALALRGGADEGELHADAGQLGSNQGNLGRCLRHIFYLLLYNYNFNYNSFNSSNQMISVASAALAAAIWFRPESRMV